MIKYIYVAGPYTQGAMVENVRNAIAAGDILAMAGYIPFIPHLSHFWDLLLSHDYRFWMEQDLAWLVKCDAILRLPGYSPGADEEVKFARDHRIKILIFSGDLKVLPEFVEKYTKDM
jgi:hypothetical protein